MTQLSVTGFLVASVLIEDDSNRKEPLRVLGMDDSGKNWHTTKLAVEAWSTKSRVRQSRLSAKKKDRYGSIFGTVYLGDRNVSLEQVAGGCAWCYRHYARDVEREPMPGL